MVQAAEEHCRKRGCTYMVITVLTLRPELPPYYRKLGYVETGIIEEFHTPRAILSDAECKLVVMSKAL